MVLSWLASTLRLIHIAPDTLQPDWWSGQGRAGRQDHPPRFRGKEFPVFRENSSLVVVFTPFVTVSAFSKYWPK